MLVNCKLWDDESGIQEMSVDIISARFPALTELAKQQAAQANSPAALDKLARKAVTVPDEDAVRWLLSPPVAS
jgi:hypothetical protein